MQTRTGDPTPKSITLTNEGQRDTTPEQQQNPSQKPEDPNAEKRTLRDMQTRAGDTTPAPITLQDTTPEDNQNPDDSQQDSNDQDDDQDNDPEA